MKKKLTASKAFGDLPPGEYIVDGEQLAGLYAKTGVAPGDQEALSKALEPHGLRIEDVPEPTTSLPEGPTITVGQNVPEGFPLRAGTYGEAEAAAILEAAGLSPDLATAFDQWSGRTEGAPAGLKDRIRASFSGQALKLLTFRFLSAAEYAQNKALVVAPPLAGIAVFSYGVFMYWPLWVSLVTAYVGYNLAGIAILAAPRLAVVAAGTLVLIGIRSVVLERFIPPPPNHEQAEQKRGRAEEPTFVPAKEDVGGGEPSPPPQEDEGLLGAVAAFVENAGPEIDGDEFHQAISGWHKEARTQHQRARELDEALRPAWMLSSFAPKRDLYRAGYFGDEAQIGAPEFFDVTGQPVPDHITDPQIAALTEYDIVLMPAAERIIVEATRRAPELGELWLGLKAVAKDRPRVNTDFPADIQLRIELRKATKRDLLDLKACAEANERAAEEMRRTLLALQDVSAEVLRGLGFGLTENGWVHGAPRSTDPDWLAKQKRDRLQVLDLLRKMRGEHGDPDEPTDATGRMTRDQILAESELRDTTGDPFGRATKSLQQATPARPYESGSAIAFKAATVYHTTRCRPLDSGLVGAKEEWLVRGDAAMKGRALCEHCGGEKPPAKKPAELSGPVAGQNDDTYHSNPKCSTHKVLALYAEKGLKLLHGDAAKKDRKACPECEKLDE